MINSIQIEGNIKTPSINYNFPIPVGSIYSVKYLGIVDGSMGILSRKMAIQGIPKDPLSGAMDILKVNQKLQN